MRVLCVDNKPLNPQWDAPHLIEGNIYHPVEDNVKIGDMLYYRLDEFPLWYFAMRLFVLLGDDEVSQEEVEEMVYQLVEKV